MPLLAGLGPLGVPELLIIAFIVVLVFGVGRLPEVGGALGKGIREFRKATNDDEHGATASASSSPSAEIPPAQPASPVTAPPPATQSSSDANAGTASDTRFCSECGARNTRSAKFCAECGNAMSAVAR
jgi:TatA/E family protein of Tat protein translocase